jgi:hypothetical protein
VLPPQCYHHSATTTVLPQCYHHSATTTVLPPQCYHHSATAAVLPPQRYHRSATTTVLPPQCYHHSATTTVLPPQCYHHSATSTLLPTAVLPPQCCHHSATTKVLPAGAAQCPYLGCYACICNCRSVHWTSAQMYKSQVKGARSRGGTRGAPQHTPPLSFAVRPLTQMSQEDFAGAQPLGGGCPCRVCVRVHDCATIQRPLAPRSVPHAVRRSQAHCAIPAYAIVFCSRPGLEWNRGLAQQIRGLLN